MTEALPEQLVTYLAKREAERATAVTQFLAKLTPRERALVRDAAVMGYIRGRRHPEGDPDPRHGEVVNEVIDACFAFPDLYPAVNGIARTKAPADQQNTGA